MIMSITIVTGYATPQREPTEKELSLIEDIIDDIDDFPFEFCRNSLNALSDEIDTGGKYDAYRYDILSELTEMLQMPVFKNLQFAGEFSINTYTEDEEGNTDEVSQIIEIVDSIAFPSLKINPDASSFITAPVFTQEEMTRALKEEASASYEQGYQEGFAEGDESARMDIAYSF